MFDFDIQNETFETTATVASHKTLAHAFMERLARDDAFRAYTLANPVAAAAQYGFRADPSQLPAGGVKLPSKEVLNEQLDRIAEKFAASASVVKVFHI
jgi:putative modified peptide